MALYRPSRHLERTRDSFERQGKDPEAFVRSHVRRLEALRRAGHVERVDADRWKVPKDIVERGQAYDLSQGGDAALPRAKSNIGKRAGISAWITRSLEKIDVAISTRCSSAVRLLPSFCASTLWGFH